MRLLRDRVASFQLDIHQECGERLPENRWVSYRCRSILARPRGFRERDNTMTRQLIKCLILTFLLASCVAVVRPAHAQYVPASGSGITKWAPAQKPTTVGPVDVGVILIVFPDTTLSGGIPEFKTELDNMHGMTQEAYFKIYSNGITWPVAKIFPNEDEGSIYHAPQCYGYYCKYDFWTNPIGWKSTGDGSRRASQLRADALQAARSKSSAKFRTIAYSYITTFNPDRSLRPDLRRYYAGGLGGNPQKYPDPTIRANAPVSKQEKDKLPELTMGGKPFDPWDWYHPSVAWGEPMWANSIIQFNNASAGTFAHEFGHTIGAPDIYRVGRANDGIGGTPVLFAYGPTATAFSRYYHHGYLPEKNYPTLTESGTYTLYPRHITPEHDEAPGYVIPSKHPHYFYHIEYIYGENPALGAGGADEVQTHAKGLRSEYFSAVEGVLISVINLGESNYLGSPDGFYTYRPNDPWFRGVGDLDQCLFGSQYNRQIFNMTSEPSSRLPNLLDGGVSFKNITEHQGTATFDVEIDKTPVTQEVYKESLLPQVRLEPIDEVLPTSFRMALTVKFRGEPLIDQYGMCWSTSKNPQITNEHYTLSNCNYDMVRGRALNLRPNTKYYVKAWATNAKGTRYSDEELEVMTPSLATDVQEAGPLLLDSFSDNGMLHDRFSNDSFDRYGYKTPGYESYAPVAVLAKLAAYYHPEGLPAPHGNVAPNPARGDTLGPGHELIVDVNPKAGSSKTPIDFGRLHWDPRENDPAWRTVETLSLFEQMRADAKACKMYDLTLNRDFLSGFNRIFRHKMEPVFRAVTDKNLEETLKLIKTELTNARPVIVIESPQMVVKNPDHRLQWGLIDGFRNGKELHIDFPRDTDVLKSKADRVKDTTLDTLIFKDYDLAVVTHISF
jgi:hypothetical protein